MDHRGSYACFGRTYNMQRLRNLQLVLGLLMGGFKFKISTLAKFTIAT